MIDLEAIRMRSAIAGGQHARDVETLLREIERLKEQALDLSLDLVKARAELIFAERRAER